jgi:hypothetical protein
MRCGGTAAVVAETTLDGDEEEGAFLVDSLRVVVDTAECFFNSRDMEWRDEEIWKQQQTEWYIFGFERFSFAGVTQTPNLLETHQHITMWNVKTATVVQHNQSATISSTYHFPLTQSYSAIAKQRSILYLSSRAGIEIRTIFYF